MPGGVIINASILIGAVFLSGINEALQAKPKLIVAVEPLVCDLVHYNINWLRFHSFASNKGQHSPPKLVNIQGSIE